MLWKKEWPHLTLLWDRPVFNNDCFRTFSVDVLRRCKESEMDNRHHGGQMLDTLHTRLDDVTATLDGIHATVKGVHRSVQVVEQCQVRSGFYVVVVATMGPPVLPSYITNADSSRLVAIATAILS